MGAAASTTKRPVSSKSKNATASSGGALAPGETCLGKGFSDMMKDYDLGRVLGRGAFGTTRLVTKKGDEKRLLACKSIAKRKLTCIEDIEDVRREIEIMHHLKGHPNVTYVVATYEDEKNIHIIMELCSGGELFDRIVSRGQYSEKDAATLIRTIVSVVAHCHNMGVMHRDLKPENFLLESADESAPLKCTDFGLSIYIKPDERLHDVVGSAFYIAPEVLDRDYGPEADIWSCGVILYVLLSGSPPFWGDSEEALFDAIQQAGVNGVSFEDEGWASISDQAKDCIKRMLDPDPSKRATADEILQHPWMKENGVASSKPLGNAIAKRMGAFANANKLKREAMRVIAHKMPSEEIAGLKAVFQAIDADNSGTITVAELWEGLKAKGDFINLEELEKVVSNMDMDGSGTIDYEEFLAATLSQHQLQNEESLMAAFKHFDANNDGMISREELRAAIKEGLAGETITEAEIEELLAEVDSDGSGSIDYQEFCDMLITKKEKATEGALRSGPTKKRKEGGVTSMKM